MIAARKERKRFHVGDWVAFRFGTSDLFAQVAEERGPLGINRRQLYRIQVDRDGDEPDSFELPEDELRAAAPPDKTAIVSYLASGGLVKILQSNLNGGREQPKVWLTFSPRGEVSHTFVPERGIVGGAPVPFFALHEGKVFKGKESDVAHFLGGFQLNRDEVDSILKRVGMAP